MKKGIQKGIEEVREEGEKKKAIEIAKNLLDVLDDETIAFKTSLAAHDIRKFR